MLIGISLVVALLLLFAAAALAADDVLYIETAGIYGSMTMSYSAGYMPSIKNGYAEFVLPLISRDATVTSIAVTPNIATDGSVPFVHGNYAFDVVPDSNGVFVVSLSLPLKQNRVNGTYPVAFNCTYTNGAGETWWQDFPVYLTITDGRDPNAPAPTPTPSAAPVVDQLRIDSHTLYGGMEKTYAQGYVPLVAEGRVYIVLPLVGQTYDGKVTVTADFGAASDTPFVMGNYSQTAGGQRHNYGSGVYVFAMEIPLIKDRINGTYPVVLKADYLDALGKKAAQEFKLNVTITDGKHPRDPNEVAKVEVEKPELFISDCSVTPDVVGGDEAFTVTVTVDNIGAIRARAVRLSYGSEAAGIVPVETNSAMNLENIASGESAAASFQLRTTKDVLAGNQPFYVTLDYVDLYGGVYTSTRTFLVGVTRPAEIAYDSISVPKTVTAGETLSLPANVFNIGKSTLRNVTITVTGAGLFPVSSVFLGDIAPGKAGNGELKLFIGMLSMTEGYTESYGKTIGKYTITYTDDADEAHAIALDFSTEIKQPVIEEEKKAPETIENPAFQWWVTILVGLAVIAIIVTGILLTRFSRLLRVGKE